MNSDIVIEETNFNFKPPKSTTSILVCLMISYVYLETKFSYPEKITIKGFLQMIGQSM